MNKFKNRLYVLQAKPKSRHNKNYSLHPFMNSQLISFITSAYLEWRSTMQQLDSGPFMKTLQRLSQAGLREGSVIQPSRYSSRWVAILVPPKTDRAASLWAVGDGTNRVDGEHFSHRDLLSLSRIVPTGDSTPWLVSRRESTVETRVRWHLEVARDRRGAFTVV